MAQTPKCTELSCDDYFDIIQSRKKIPNDLQDVLTEAFTKIPVSSFPDVPGGKVIEISADTMVADAVKTLSAHNITSAPVTNPKAVSSSDWRERYLGIIDYSAIILWVLDNADLAASALSTGMVTATGVGAGAVGALGAMALGATAPVAVAGLAVAAVGGAVASGIAADKEAEIEPTTVVDALGEDFYKVLLNEEPFKSTTVRSILKSYRWAPFLPVASDSCMLSVMLLLSKYRLRNIPVIELGKPTIKNFITQSAVVKGLEKCKGRDWFDSIAGHPISDLGLPFMSYKEVVSVQTGDLILEAFRLMKDNQIGGLPVIQGEGGKIVGSISIKDIRFLLLQPELFANFRQLKVMDFMRVVTSSKQDIAHTIMPPTMCGLDASLQSIIETLASKQVHRVYVVASNNDEVVGVITLRDVISCFVYEPPKHFDNYYGFAMKEILARGTSPDALALHLR